MDPLARQQRAKAIFLDALEVPQEGRVAFVESRALGDPDLANEVLSLLGHHRQDPLLARDRAPQTGRDPLGVEGATLDGRYRVQQFVDEGGFSYVYRGEHLLWKRPVALKFHRDLLAEAGDQERLKDAFVQEGALLNELSRRTLAIVQSYDVGTWSAPSGDTLLFTVLEWLDGRTLAQLLREERRGAAPKGWPLERVTRTLDPVADALAIAHERGIAHRDVKPSNVFLASDGGSTTAKLIDFGVAKVAGPTRGFELTTASTRPLTPGYAAPEQLRRTLGPTGPWTDVYSLAFLCVELMLGRHPNTDKSFLEATVSTCDPRTRPTPRAYGLQIADDVEAAFAQALRVDARERFPDARRFWEALRLK